MSKMNCLRIVNLNYNNNAIKMEDETFELNGESTLLSLQNGGGKSVLVQMMTAPFVRKGQRKTKDRAFESYFTTNRPTHILVEWQLDGGSGYVLTGLMVRRKQKTSEEENNEELDVCSIIYEYSEPNEYDIHHLPIVEQEGSQKKLLGYQAVLKLYDKIKQERNVHFQRYDMNQPGQQRQYFTRLKQYQIHYTEWEKIIKKVNLKESGLSELFIEAKDEAGLVEKWFLPAVEDKLNVEEDRIKQFTSILNKYLGQYKENEAKMQHKDTILAFQKDAALVEEKVLDCIQTGKKEQEYIRKVGSLIYQMKLLLEKAGESAEESKKKIADLEQQIKQIAYEDISYQIYQKMEKREEKECYKAELEERIARLEAEKKELRKQRNILECAKLFVAYRESSMEVQKLENRLELLKQKEENILPERNQIGYNLRIFYEGEQKRRTAQLEAYGKKKSGLQAEKEKLSKEAEKLRENQNKWNTQLGALQEKIKQYADVEEKFCEQYKAELIRNILGVYEEGSLELLSRAYQKELEQTVSQITAWKQERTKHEETIVALSRDLEDKKETIGEQKGLLQNAENQLESYREELTSRLELLRYVGFTEEQQFMTEAIAEAFLRKIESLEEGRRQIERDIETLEQQYHNMESGRDLKLSKEFMELLHSLDIDYVYGMEFLKKNKDSVQQKEQLVKENPLLPYSILMSQKELEQLKSAEVNLYTSTPVPIVVRETMSQGMEQMENGIVQAGTYYFFAAFNEHLLDEEALKVLLTQKKEEINSQKEKLEIKKEEIRFYREKSNLLQNQKVTKEKLKECKKQIEQLKESMQQAQEEINKGRQKKEELQTMVTKLSDAVELESKKELKYKERKNAFDSLIRSYGEYLEHRAEKELTQGKLNEDTIRIAKIEEERNSIAGDIEKLSGQIQDENSQLSFVEEKALIYKDYQEGEKIDKDIEDLEARYKAITEKLGNDLVDLETRLERERKLFKRHQDELVKKQDEAELEETEFRDVPPNEVKEEELKREEQKVKKSLKAEEGRKNETEKEIAVLESQCSGLQKKMKEECHQDELVPKEQITDTAFTKRIRLVKEEQAEEKKRYMDFEETRRAYEANVTSLSEYEEFEQEVFCDFSEELSRYQAEDISQLNRKNLDKFRGELIRDYRKSKEEVAKKQSILHKKMNDMLYDTQYQEEFFHKTLETMLQVVNQPEALLEQLTITRDSYQSLLEKLEFDLSIVAEEKEKIQELLFQYVMDVHKHLGKIDRNSAITVRGKSIKMLKLIMQDWDEQESVFLVRLKDFMEDLTKRAMERLEQNQNMEELLGKTLTTRNLYNSVVGIGTIGIKLYKIEADREYPITWKEVSKNSGGEGFLSAFVILSSLLSYMRRDDTDLFAGREEGKVLVMDNPFAQTNAAHLLKPLMDVAKKSNTQLICLSGLGGESIYNRFDNIYVMNLMSSGLQKDIRYVSAEHIKGTETEVSQTVQASRIEVEQMSFIF